MSAVAACAGQWELFDSTNELDHIKAKTLCGECPMRVECEQRLTAARNRAHKGGSKDYGPQGTWAGRLIGSARSTSERVAIEDAMFTDDELRDGHAAWNAGDRGDIARVAERIYQRKRSRRRWAAKKEAA